MLIARVETQTELLVTARAAQRGGDFETSYAAFSRAGAAGPLAVYDLDAMSIAAGCLGHGREATRVGELVYLRLTRTDPHAAAGKAAELGAVWLSRGEWVAGQTWIRRARGLLAGGESATSRRLAYLEAVAAAFAAYASALSDSARADVRAALASSSGDTPRLLRGAAQIALAAGDLDEAEHYLRELDSVADVDSVLRGAVLVRRGRYREALTVLQTALRHSGYETGEVYGWINEAYRGQGATGR
ncbi:tetratricopeptide repeat protein [Mycolicibacterium sp. Dal123E01]|uniref:tetratricopeptide repeat protein n=1 Tax=Mycolicibacterium sp. Dal123E01 TaxID=3457578 RepID=UPI00403EC2C4